MVEDLTRDVAGAVLFVESADDALDRLAAQRNVVELSQEVWYNCLAVIHPKLMKGTWFMCGQRGAPLKLFWITGGRHYAKQLSWQQTWDVCNASGLPKNYT